MAGARDLHGTWALKRWVVETAEGEERFPFGPDATGYICYAPDGHVHVNIMTTDRPDFSDPDPMSGTAEEHHAAGLSHISYAGRFEVSGDEVLHHVTVASFPNWAPSLQRRRMIFRDGELELSAGPMAWGGETITHRLIWFRV